MRTFQNVVKYAGQIQATRNEVYDKIIKRLHSVAISSVLQTVEGQGMKHNNFARCSIWVWTVESYSEGWT